MERGQAEGSQIQSYHLSWMVVAELVRAMLKPSGCFTWLEACAPALQAGGRLIHGC